ncbi:methionine adenosyltransferase [Caulobacter sp. NIBR1757]|uniref:methionine adenosyltransferase n=1 Tax=Caulobacter sp. NIBR1757 TaxID=3016000 RepID=UPI0022F0045E|nr:methionine adenosyltransferase [Caulobacter sp. NIBR1757]WGM40023.1 S-adenosylmethionine synthase [Caulobacter sp. NIBR1757]
MTMHMPTAAVSAVTERTAEHVGRGHPDKATDQMADALLDNVLEIARKVAGDDENSLDHPRYQRTAIEALTKDNLVMLSGEMKLGPKVAAAFDPEAVIREVWRNVGYAGSETMTVINHLRRQSADITRGVDLTGASEGAGDQGIMVGYATNETPTMMPLEWDMAQRLAMAIDELQRNRTLPWLGSDIKTQVTLSAADEVIKVIIAAQHAEEVSTEEVRRALMEQAVMPLMGDIDPDQVVINGTGRFVTGGPIGDAGVVGRKIVVDAYGPGVPVGGGAYSGKDPTKVDRSAAYMARHVAKAVVAHRVSDANACMVRIAYGIGQTQPAMVTAMTDNGQDLGAWVRRHFDLSPRGIINSLDLLRMSEGGRGWAYQDAAAFGHYGRAMFPWERIADVV